MRTEKMEKMEKRVDRRKKIRFPIHRELRYRLLDHDGLLIGSGMGQTVNMSSSGIAFSIDRELNPGTFMELSVSWPMLLDETCPLRFIVFGRVIRSLGKRSVCSVEKHEFRTQARTFQTPLATRQDAGLERWAVGIRKEALKPRVATVASAS
jgi:hypothetical protein